MSLYEPQPKFAPKRLPRQQPRKVIPSYIGESGQVGNWLFYNGFGDRLYDFSGKGNSGEITNARWRDGSYGWGLEFGADRYVALPKAVGDSIYASQEFTAIGWLLWRTPNDGDYDAFFEFLNGSQTVSREEGDGLFHWYVNDGSWNETVSTTTINADTFYCIACRFDHGDMALFVNGSPAEDTLSIGSMASVTTDNILGAIATKDRYWLDGLMVMSQLYDVAKSDTFIDAYFEHTRGIFGV